jgi:Protein of unknown function (DUF2911)
MKQNKSIFHIAAMLGAIFMLLSAPANAQDDKAKRPSPAATASATVGTAMLKIDYSRPSVKGRKVWGEMVPMGQVWRTGANEATTFETDKPVMIEGKELPAGKYALFTIPGEKEWTIIFNKDAKQWGSYQYKQDKDALRVMVKPMKSEKLVEQLTFAIDPKGVVNFMWENVQVSFKVKAK